MLQRACIRSCSAALLGSGAMISPCGLTPTGITMRAVTEARVIVDIRPPLPIVKLKTRSLR
jgi:hypothetical protein